MTPVDCALGRVEKYHVPAFEYGEAVQIGADANAALKLCAVVVAPDELETRPAAVCLTAPASALVTKASVATAVLLSPGARVTAAVPDGSDKPRPLNTQARVDGL
jgi:hypothetical protein